MTAVRESVRTTYLGYILDVDERRVTVFTPTLRRIGDAASIKSARLIVRGYRRAEKAAA